MTEIRIKKLRDFPDALFEAVLRGKPAKTYKIGFKEDYFKRLSRGRITPEKLLENSFEFLLRHEASDEILPEFELPDIGRYFPSYEEEMRDAAFED